MSLELIRAMIERTAMVGSPAKDKQFVESAIEAICSEWAVQGIHPHAWQVDQLLLAVGATASGAYPYAIERVHKLLEAPDAPDQRPSAIGVEQLRRALVWLRDVPVHCP